MIHWHAFDWQSFATLTAGVVAVAGAVVVGLRQTEVLRKQTEIAELTLRHDLFEKRYAVFAAAREFLGAILQTAARVEPPVDQAFLRAIGESQFLFRPSVHGDLRAIWERYSAFVVLKAEMDSVYRREGHYGDGNPQRENEMLTALIADLNALPDLFGDELKLGGRR